MQGFTRTGQSLKSRTIVLFAAAAAVLLSLPLTACASDPAGDFDLRADRATDSSFRNVQSITEQGTFGQSSNNQAETVLMHMDTMKLLGSGVQTKAAVRSLGIIGATSAGMVMTNGKITMSEEPVTVPGSFEGAEDVYFPLKQLSFAEFRILPAEGNAGIVDYITQIRPYYESATKEQRAAYEASVEAWKAIGLSALEAARAAFPALLGMPSMPPARTAAPPATDDDE